MHDQAAQLSSLPWQALIKALGLGYLLGLLGMALAAGLWARLRPRLSSTGRSLAASWLLLGAAALQALLAVFIWRGVVTHQIQMTTMHFHKLMHGEWSAVISIVGMTVLAASLLIATWSFRRTRLDGHATSPLAATAALPLRATPQVATAALVGVVRPQIWVNPQWWGQLSEADQEVAFAHELAHWRSGDNLRKLLLEWLAILYAILPRARRWLSEFDLDCELAVDAQCREKYGEDRYRRLLSNAARFVLERQLAASGARLEAQGSGLGSSGLRERLRLLDAAPGKSPAAVVMVIAGGWLLSITPSLLLLSHPIPRCFLACYLGY